MVKVAIAGATSQLARVVIDRLASSGKHEILALVRRPTADLPKLAGVTWIQTDWESKEELVKILSGVHTVLCFFTVHLDPGNANQKRLIDASVEAGVKRFAPAEWSTNTELAESLDLMPWYAGKVEVAQYLKDINAEKKVLEYTLFQPGGFMETLGHPHKTVEHVQTIPFAIDIEKKQGIAIEGSLDDHITFTTVTDIAGVVAGALEYEGEWPIVGGIQGDRVTIGDLIKYGEDLKGPLAIDWLKKEDLEAGVIKSDKYPRVDLPSIPKDQIEEFSKMASIGILQAYSRGTWDTGRQWNDILDDYKFTSVKEFLNSVFSRK